MRTTLHAVSAFVYTTRSRTPSIVSRSFGSRSSCLGPCVTASTDLDAHREALIRREHHRSESPAVREPHIRLVDRGRLLVAVRSEHGSPRKRIVAQNDPADANVVFGPGEGLLRVLFILVDEY